MHPFGSKASGLELWNSDIDVVVLGLVQPTGSNGGRLFKHLTTFRVSVRAWELCVYV